MDDLLSIKEACDKLRIGDDAFHELMRWRVRRVLLVLPHYDAWILEHDAKLSDQIVGEYHQLNLTTVPRLSTVADGMEGLHLLQEESFDLMIIGMRTGDLSPEELAEKAKQLHPDLPILMLFSSRSELITYPSKLQGRNLIDANFIWTGDSRLLLGMIKYIEDKKNAPSDAGDGKVGVLLVVEDSVLFYSAYLPLLYGEIMTHTQRLIAEEMNDTDKYWRMRSRPKVLLARNWGEALELGKIYKDSIIGIVSDIAFIRNGKTDFQAGFALIKAFQKMGIKVPVLFQSSNTDLADKAMKYGASFQGKLTGDLHRGIRRFILKKLGFGDFIFRNPAGKEIHRVRTMREFELAMNSLSVENLLFNAEHNDFLLWMAARGEYGVTRRLRPFRMSSFHSAEDLKIFLTQALKEEKENRHRGRLIDFSFTNPGAPGAVIRYGSGSLGGKGRGLAFFNTLLHAAALAERFSPLRIEIPRTLIIATGEFDKFLEGGEVPIESVVQDEELRQIFLNKPLHEDLKLVLKTFIARETGPLAIRSSTLLEDSQSVPFAGVYDTYMIPGGGDADIRFKLICDAVKLVWASTFSTEARKYRDALGIGQDEEKMAVVIQRVAGRQYGEYWFPRLSGTAQSLNYYPIGPMNREDGASRIAVGLGRSIVEGDRGFLFCPRYPMVPWGTEEDRWREGQTYFWALQNDPNEFANIDLAKGQGSTMQRLSIRDAEKLQVLGHMVSTWDPIGHRLVDGTEFFGPRVVDYRDILAYEWLPLASLLDYLLRIARGAMGIPVELEFSLDWKGDLPEETTFSLLQVRPLISQTGVTASLPTCPEDSQLILRSKRTLGHGMVDNVRDIVWVEPSLYNPAETETFQRQIGEIMECLAAENKHSILIGPGRWGSRDRFLGIPVSWAQVRQAKLIIEITRDHTDPEPSQGSHFFHNLVALGVGYAHISLNSKNGFINWKSINKTSECKGAVRHGVFDHPMRIVMDGKTGSSWVEKMP